MLSNIYLKNFQGFGGEVVIPIAPLTLIFGPNSSGKSSIMKSLLFLKQSLNEASGEATFIGSDIDLGSFSNAVYKHNENNQLSVGLSFTDTSDKAIFTVDNSGKFSQVEIYGDSVDGQSRMISTKSYRATFCRLEDNNFEIKFNNKSSLNNFAMGTLATNRAMHEAMALAKVQKKFKTEHSITIAKTDPELARFQEHIKAMRFRFSNSRMTRNRPMDFKKLTMDESFIQTYSIERTLNKSIDRAKEYVDQIFHLGGLRAIPDRYEVLGNSTNALGSDAANLANFLSTKGKLVREISKWLFQFTEGTYGLELAKLQRDSRLHTDLNALILVDKKSKITTSFKDVGIGLSQVLPIITRLVQLSTPTKKAKSHEAALRMYGMRKTKPLLLLEQPELHLHPRMQLQLADLFAEASAAGNPNGPQVIVETHSENLILRLQKLIREGKLDKDSVSVLYVDRNKTSGKSQIKKLPLADNGEFLAAWPEEFADLRLEELL